MQDTVLLTINDRIKFNVPTSDSLFSVLIANKIFLPSICGGRGLCGKCKCRVLEGGGPLQAAELKRLSREEIESRFRLACQVRIDADLRIEIPDQYLHIEEYQAEVRLIRSLTYDVKLLRLALIQPREIDFRPGQFVQLKSKPYPGVGQTVVRSYSIASSGQVKDSIDLMVRLVPEGICSTWVHHHLQEGESVTFVGPDGDFFLHEGTEEAILAAGSSGMAPMVSILDEISRKTPDRPVTYFFGVCKRKDLFYLDEMAQLGRRMTRFSFIPVLSEPDEEDQCAWETGLVTVPLQAYLRKKNPLALQLYLCGSPPMVRGCKEIAMQSGVPGDKIYHDPFG
jgi:Na+-transporting NADH:ubiquinone oxidoreductase subunit F